MFQSFIPYDKIEPRRKTRSLLPFVGYLSKSLFVTATMDDVNISAPQINALTKTSNNIIYALQKHNEHMPSFVSTATKEWIIFNLQHLEFVVENTTSIISNQ